MHRGTPQFTAPEVFSGGDYGFTVGAFAFAMLMHAVLTGPIPFPDASPYGPGAACDCRGVREPRLRGAHAGVLERRARQAPGLRACLEGLDVDAVKEYQARVCPPDLVPRKVGRARPPIEELRRMADSGDARSQVRFGEALQAGDGVAPDMREAVRYLRMAADRNNPDGLVALGLCLGGQRRRS
jgi:hypothetical protein